MTDKKIDLEKEYIQTLRDNYPDAMIEAYLNLTTHEKMLGADN